MVHSEPAYSDHFGSKESNPNVSLTSLFSLIESLRDPIDLWTTLLMATTEHPANGIEHVALAQTHDGTRLLLVDT